MMSSNNLFTPLFNKSSQILVVYPPLTLYGIVAFDGVGDVFDACDCFLHGACGS